MKHITLTKGKVAVVDDEDYEWLSKYKWCFNGYGYAVRGRKKHEKVNGRRGVIFLHREVMKTPTGMITDHINKNTLDNQKKNLRICTPSQNNQNMKVRKDSFSGERGIRYITDRPTLKKRWLARIQYNYKQINLGYYKTMKEAIAARKMAVEKLWDWTPT